jgi:hypothetical protein
LRINYAHSSDRVGLGCQIFLDTRYQNGYNVTNAQKIYPFAINKLNGHTVFQMVIKDINIFHSKDFQNAPKLKVWFEKKQSGNPGVGNT